MENSKMYETPDGGIRLPRPYTGRKMGFGAQKHFTGSLVHGEDEGAVMDVESHTEMLVALVMLARRDVVLLENEVSFPWFDADGSERLHRFDFRVTLRDGRRIALMVKWSTEAQKPKFKSKTARIASQVTSTFADEVLVVTELDLDPIEVHNAELIHAVRVPEPDVDAAARRSIQTLVGAARIGDLVTEIGREGCAFRGVVRLIRSHDLQLVDHERITYDTLVRRRVS
jgi:hypothetical protein